MLLTIVSLAYTLRYTWVDNAADSWHRQWHRVLLLFLLPPLLLLTSAIAIVWMGPHGQMVWEQEGWLSYLLAIGFLGLAAGNWLQLASQGLRLVQQIRTYPVTKMSGHPVRVLNLPTAYIAQIGFWEPELVITQGLLALLDNDHLAAVIAHEQAHYQYRDTFCFFWLGWIRQLTAWLPQTEVIWQELLILREIRADRWASQQTDPLLVAEALFLVVQNTAVFADNIGVTFSQLAPSHRLNQRIDALLSTAESPVDRPSPYSWVWLLLAFLPLLVIPFHN
jgi:Zn-dependent protease with chaperone function